MGVLSTLVEFWDKFYFKNLKILISPFYTTNYHFYISKYYEILQLCVYMIFQKNACVLRSECPCKQGLKTYESGQELTTQCHKR